MDATFLRKTFALIAKGLVEKEQLLQKEPTRYPYSKALQHGINMFLVASHQIGAVQDIVQYADEAAFLKHFISKPVSEWFDEWDPNEIDSLNLQEEAFYSYGAFAYQRSGNLYSPSSECYEYLESQDNDIMDGTDERVLYEKIIVLGQETYCRIRRYIIEHPIISIDERRAMSLELADNPDAREAFQFAYEEIRENSYRCPCCGWTMTCGKYGYICHSSHCVDTIPNLTDDMKLDASGGGLYRLKKGIMRYFAAPGKLELDIVAFCQKKNIHWVLWPQLDRYDVEIQFSDGEVWEIDAKAYRNPIALRTKILNDNGFPTGDYARGYNARIRQFAARQWNKMSKTKAFGIAELSEDERKDVVATLFVLILQIFGRLARVTDVSRPAPHVYFIDGAFRRRPEKAEDFDCLSELGQYLEELMTQKESAEIAKTLYAPFYQAYRKDISYEQ